MKLDIDDALLARARELSGTDDNSGGVREALKVLIADAAGRRLAAMGMTQPTLVDIPRRRSPDSAQRF